MQVRNIQYYTAFMGFFRRFMNHLSKLEKEDLPKQYINTLEFGANGHPYPTIKQTTDFHQLVERSVETLKEWPEYEDLKNNLILVDVVGKKFKDRDDFNLIHNLIPNIAHDLYQESGECFRYRKKTIEAKYALIENGIYKSEWTYSVKTPLYNIGLETDQMTLGNNIVISRISKEDLHLLFGLSQSSYGVGTAPYSPFIEAILSTEESAKKTEGRVPSVESRKLFLSAVASLSIFKKAPVNCGPIYVVPKDYWTVFHGITFIGLGYQPRIPNIVKIERKEIRSYRAFWKKLKRSLDANAWLELACERLVEYHNKRVLSDRIIDLMTIFEILYLPEAEGELKFRLSTRCSKLLIRKNVERRNVFDRLKLAYDIRSNLVHSGKISRKSSNKLKALGTNLNDLIKALEIYLYNSFHVFARNPEKRSDLDTILLS